jgi:ketosteroid isomerase-like protein
MAEDIVELTDRAFEALNRRDLDAVLEVFDPEAEFGSLIAESEGAVYHGHDGIRQRWGEVANSLGGINFRIEGRRAIDDERVVLKLKVSGEVTGVAVEQAMWAAIEGRDGKAVWWRVYRTEDEALARLEERRAG